MTRTDLEWFDLYRESIEENGPTPQSTARMLRIIDALRSERARYVAAFCEVRTIANDPEGHTFRHVHNALDRVDDG